jgi:hypothetical protein
MNLEAGRRTGRSSYESGKFQFFILHITSSPYRYPTDTTSRYVTQSSYAHHTHRELLAGIVKSHRQRLVSRLPVFHSL